MKKSIMDYSWIDEGDGKNEFTQESIGANGEPDGQELADRLNTAANYLVIKYGIDINEARCRLWNQGDCYPRMIMVEEAMSISPLSCTRCNHRWYPRTPNKPKFCPKCNSPYWDKPRRKYILKRA